MQNKSPEKQKIKCAKKMRDIMTAYYIEALGAAGANKKIAWITSGGPVEPLVAMDIIPVYPENHGAMIGAAKMGAELCAKASDMGYSADLCSYARADIACSITKTGPIGGLPAPDMLICCNNICGTVLKWYEIQARFYNVPLFILDTPVCHTGYSRKAASYVRAQIDEYIGFLEKNTGRKMDPDKMADVGRLSFEAQELWQKILDTTMHRPSPMSAFDAFFFLALIVTLRGTKVVVDFYNELLNELKDRIKNNISIIPNEKYRLLWDNLPVWYKLKWLSAKFSDHDACFVADTYTSAWCSAMKYIDKNNFLDSMAQGYAQIYLNLGVDKMAVHVVDMIKKYDADALVMHSNRSCKPYSFGQMDIMRTVRQKTGVPVLMLEADMVDPAHFAESQIETRIDAFMEMIDLRSA